jgi:hypothetical protein
LIKSIYPGERLIFTAGRTKENRKRLGEATKVILPAGYIVTRVYTKAASDSDFS